MIAPPSAGTATGKFALICLIVALSVAPTELCQGASGAAPDARTVGAAPGQPDDLELSQGPEFPPLPGSDKAKAKRPRDPVDMLQPFDAAAFLRPLRGGRVSGLVHFSDTAGGLRITASVEGLEPGTYELRADENFYGPDEDMNCDVAKKLETAKPPVAWRLGPLRAGSDGIARLDRVYAGVGLHSGAYTVPAEPVMRRRVHLVTIDLRRFALHGRKLTLHKRQGRADGGVEEPMACAIIHDPRTYATTPIEPLPGYAAHGSANLEQGEDNRAKLEIKLSSLKPGKYRLVVHEFADCGNATSAGVGEPYHPEDNTLVTEPHYPWPLKRGVLGTFTANKAGKIEDEKIFNHPLTSGSPHTIRGRAIIVESVASDPQEKAAPVACGMAAGF